MSRLATAPQLLTEELRKAADGARGEREEVRPAFLPSQVLVFSVWLGLLTGLLELVALYARRHFADHEAVTALELNQHARWMIPLSHALILLSCGLPLAGLARDNRWRKLVGAGIYGLSFLSVLSLLSTYRGLTTIASMSLGSGITLWLAPALLVHARRPTQLVRMTLPAMILLLLGFYGLNVGREKLDERWLPAAPAGAPNVLFIVLDTVRAESLSLYGYTRQTSPHLAELARRGVRFDQARATAAWTLPSHASMFTGRWPYELSTRPDRPLDDTYPTLAEFLRNHGYATAGFAANTYFCSQWYGLGRGFMHYEDVALTATEIVRSSIMGRYLLRKLSPYNSSRPTAYFERKDAVTINHETLEWLANRSKDRPFFAFLNYYDAHDPYLAPGGAPRHFGCTPTTSADVAILRDWLNVVTSQVSSHNLTLARDCYDDCIAYLDNQVDRLFSELHSRGLLDNTLVIITADHGELIGERGAYGHGQSLHHEAINVPLLIIAPRRVPSGRVVSTPVSLRDLPATVVELVGLGKNSPFPGRSLAKHWSANARTAAEENDLLLTETADEVSKNSPLARSGRSLLLRNKLYIRNRDGREELYDLAVDRAEEHDLSTSVQAQSLMAEFRDTMRGVDEKADAFEHDRASVRNGSGAIRLNGNSQAALWQQDH